MSSLAAARADNFYYAPGFDPDKHKTLNKFNGQHPLRERAAKLDQGILVIRFEMPFNIWCGKCNEMVAKGERFNAEKKAIGMYHSTKILQFSMRHHCGCTIVVQTDPKNAEYLVVDGGRRKAEDYDAEAAGVLQLPDDEERALLNDPFYRLEHGEAVKVKAKTEAERVVDLWDEADERHRDEFALNRKLRSQLRSAKKEDAKLDERRRELHLPDHIRLLPTDNNDKAEAQLAFFAAGDARRAQLSAGTKRRAIESESIFSSRHRTNGMSSTGSHSAGTSGRGTFPPGLPAPFEQEGQRAAPSGRGGVVFARDQPAGARSASAPARLPRQRLVNQLETSGGVCHQQGHVAKTVPHGMSKSNAVGGTTSSVKRSIKDRVQLFAKRQRLQDAGVKLGLGGAGSSF